MFITGGGSTYLNYPGIITHHHIHNLHHHMENWNGGGGSISTSNAELIVFHQHRASDGNAPNNNNNYCDDIHYTSPKDEEDYQSWVFRQAYSVFQSEWLHRMSKEQLIYTNKLLEHRVESLETKLNEILKGELEEKKVGMGAADLRVEVNTNVQMSIFLR
ncbi:unnamed protein product [Orchesella dallaii]|uniref:Uncharacterized protein n=1 Tax=Orchesella dallaii TaxID=48710 RepID=A0ABP1RKH5_9HEXA